MLASIGFIVLMIILPLAILFVGLIMVSITDDDGWIGAAFVFYMMYLIVQTMVLGNYVGVWNITLWEF